MNKQQVKELGQHLIKALIEDYVNAISKIENVDNATIEKRIFDKAIELRDNDNPPTQNTYPDN